MTEISEIDPQLRSLIEIFDPVRLQAALSAIAAETKFVHYTSASTALSIIRNKEVWMRNASMMNDFMEIQYGKDLLFPAFNDMKESIERTLNSIHDGMFDEFLKLFNGWLPTFEVDTYISCVSEHDEERERTLGRLSMWRAYGAPAGVAIVLNNRTFLRTDDRLKAYFSPITYCSKIEFNQIFKGLFERIDSRLSFLKQIDRNLILNHLFEVFKGFLLRIKHPGFYEEREWRLIYIPSIDKSDIIKAEVRQIGIIPQIVSIIPLDEQRNSIDGMRISDLIEYVIIGPCEHPIAVKRAFVRLLEESNIQDAFARVVISEIPLRSQ